MWLGYLQFIVRGRFFLCRGCIDGFYDTFICQFHIGRHTFIFQFHDVSFGGVGYSHKTYMNILDFPVTFGLCIDII